MPNLARAIFLAILTLLIATSCGETPGAAADFGDSTPRLAVLSPAGAIILRDLGFDDRIVARHGFDFVLDPAVPVGGDQTGLDYEALLNARPTDIILEQAALDVPRRLEELAQSQGWHVHTLPMLTLENIEHAIPTLDRIASGSKESTHSGHDLSAKFDSAIRGQSDACSKLGRTLLVTWTDPVGVMGPGSFHADLLEALGAAPIPTEGAAYISLDTEDVLRMDPDCIILLMPAQETSDMTQLLGSLASVGLRAITENRVILINHPHALTPSTSLIKIAETLADASASLPDREPVP